MQHRRHRPIDVLAVGELLIDFISTDFADSLFDIKQFEKWQGGSPANLSLNLARLGNTPQLVATVGADAMGDFLVQSVSAQNLDTQSIHRSNRPTTLILVTRSKEVAAFEAYRSADCEILSDHLSIDLLSGASVFHTTCFALSRKPAQTSIMEAAQKAVAVGAQLSIDLNYAAKIWPNSQEARNLIREYSSHNTLIKISEVDWERLYATPLADPKKATDHFLRMGASWVCVTLGDKGCYIATENEAHTLPARAVEVQDTTGAGDAFWSGFLTAFLDGYGPLDCAKAGRSMAEIKITHLGSLPARVLTEAIYADIAS